MLLEQYQFPHLYQLQKTGNRYAELQLLRQLTFSSSISLESDVSRFLPTFTFEIYDHPRPETNARWWTISVHHKGEQPGVLQHEAPAERGLYYQSKVTAIPHMTRFIPAIEHPKNRVEALQSAVVTGPENEEVYCDE
jgi:type VI secretion system secreted protein VgrG